MNAPTSILAALVDLHERLAKDPAWGLAPEGYSPQKIAFAVVLTPQGGLFQIRDLRRLERKKLLPEILIVPGGAKSPGSGLNPGFLWDNPPYLLGYSPDRDAKKVARAARSFEAFRDRHLAAEAAVGCPEYSAVCAFLRSWTPPANSPAAFLDDLTGGFGVFQIQGQPGYVHELPPVCRYWESLGSKEEVVAAQCLVTGEVGPIARLHEPMIKGVANARQGGAPLVSFNEKAYESYGREQSYNAPVSQSAVRRYCTALNALLAGSPQRTPQRLSVGDTTVVFWTAKPTQTESLFADAFGGIPPGGESAQDESRLSKVRQFFSALRAGGGRTVPTGDEPQIPFYLLGLAAATPARLSVRFWQVSTLGDLAAKLAAHYEALRLVRVFEDLRNPEFPTIRDLLDQTAVVLKKRPDPATIPPMLGGALLRSVLTGGPYPHAFASAVIRRIRADRLIDPAIHGKKPSDDFEAQRCAYLRVAALKAFLIRQLKITMNEALDPNRPEPAYHLGRLFAVYETAQKHAHDWKLERTIRETMYSAASATPLAVFGRLERMFHHHTREKRFPPGSSDSYADLVGEINQRFRGSPIYPPALDLAQQALFAVGYYHQLHHLRSLQEAKSNAA